MTLSDWLDAVSVMEHGAWVNELSPKLPQWFAVCTDDDGIIAYFNNSTDAYRFRLDYINRKLNP